MVHKVRMPKIDPNVEEASVGSWQLDVGQWVGKGDKLVEIITDKASFELETEQSGYLREKLAPEKSVLPVGYVMGLLSDDPNESLPDVSQENKRLMRQHRERMFFGAAPEEPPAEAGGDSEGAGDAAERAVRATPAARRLARREGLSVEEIGTEGGAVVREEDVRKYLRVQAESE